jgi:hypothetical protein
MNEKIDFFPLVKDETGEHRRKGKFTPDQLDMPISLQRVSQIYGLSSTDLLPLLETEKIHAFKRWPVSDWSSRGAYYEPLWSYEYKSMVPPDLEGLYFYQPEIEKLQTSGTKLSTDTSHTGKLRIRFKTERALEQAVEMADQLLNIRRVNPRITRSELKKDYKTYFPGKQAWSTFERNMQALQASGDKRYKDLLPKNRPGSKKRMNP